MKTQTKSILIVAIALILSGCYLLGGKVGFGVAAIVLGVISALVAAITD